MFDKDLLKKIDWITILLVLTLFIIGLTSIASIMADPFDGTEASIVDYLDKLNLYYVKKQLVNFMIGFAAMLVFMVVDYKVFKFLIKYVYAANLVLLIIRFFIPCKKLVKQQPQTAKLVIFIPAKALSTHRIR